jgi:hypothetical protein
MKELTLSLVILLTGFSAFAQRVRCATDSKVVENAVLHERINQKIEELKLRNLRTSQTYEVLRIPIVVHIIHNNSSGIIGGSENPNISDEQVFSQIEVLNEDFRRRAGTAGFNNNPVGTDMEIEFFLANIDPNGRPTTGINRVYSSRRSFSVFGNDLLALSNLSYWDSSKYLNIWVTTLSSNLLGYAEMPIADFDGLEAVDIDERIDGVFVGHTVFGRGTGTVTDDLYTEGRTTTHEIGHWLGLIHIWGDIRCGTDFCDDTPTAEAANLTDFCNPIFSTCSRSASTRNMIENFMDYSPDQCMNIFTQDQKARVRAILEISTRRKKLLENLAIFNPISEPIIVRILGNPVENDYLNIQVLVNEARSFEVKIIDNLGRVLIQDSYANSLSRSIQIPKVRLGNGMLNLSVSSDKETLTHRILSL